MWISASKCSAELSIVLHWNPAQPKCCLFTWFTADFCKWVSFFILHKRKISFHTDIFLYLFHDSMFPLKVASEGSEVQNLFLVARETSLGEVNGNSLRYVLYSNCLIQFTVRCFWWRRLFHYRLLSAGILYGTNVHLFLCRQFSPETVQD